jgi:hypothetical protein
VRSVQAGVVRAPVASVEAALLASGAWIVPGVRDTMPSSLVRVGQHSFESAPPPGERTDDSPVRLDLRSVGDGTEVTMTMDIPVSLRMRLAMRVFGLAAFDPAAGVLDVILPGLEADALAIERAGRG